MWKCTWDFVGYEARVVKPTIPGIIVHLALPRFAVEDSLSMHLTSEPLLLLFLLPETPSLHLHGSKFNSHFKT